MLITVQPNSSWQLSLAQLSPSLFFLRPVLRNIRFIFVQGVFRIGEWGMVTEGEQVEFQGSFKMFQLSFRDRSSRAEGGLVYLVKTFPLMNQSSFHYVLLKIF